MLEFGGDYKCDEEQRKNELRPNCENQTKEFRWRAAQLIAKHILPTRESSVIQCNILDGLQGKILDEERACQFCKCELANTFRCRLVPRKVYGKKLKNLLRRVQPCNKKFSEVHISKFERSMLKKCNSQPANALVIACSVCQKSKKYPLKLWNFALKQRVAQPEIILDTYKKARKKKTDKSAGLKLTKTMESNKKKTALPNRSLEKNFQVTSLPGKVFPKVEPKFAAKQVNAQQNKTLNTPLLKLKSKVVKFKGTPTFIKKFKKGNKLASLLAQDELSKLAVKKTPKSNVFALLHGWVGK